MSRKVYPTPKILSVQRNESHNNSSVISINQSYLHEGYFSKNSHESSCCQYCKQIGVQSLIPICECDDKLFHKKCFKEWLSEMVKSKRVSVTQEDNYQVFQCQICQFKIKFKAQIILRCSTCSEMLQYCFQHTIFTIGIILNLLLLVGCVICLLLVLFGIIQFNPSIEKSAVLIGFGILIAIMMIICLCCSIDCLKASNFQIEIIYDRNGMGHRGTQSRRSNRSRTKSRNRSRSRSRNGNNHTLKVQNIQ